MSVFNRSFVSLLAVAWCAAMAAGLYLIWDQTRVINLDSDTVKLNFDLIFDTQAEQILATIVAGVLMLPALLLMAMEITPHGTAVRYDRKRDQEYGALQARNDVLQKQLDEERNRNNRIEKDFGHERVMARDEAKRNADAVRDTAGRPVIASDDRPVKRRNWHLLPTRHS